MKRRQFLKLALASLSPLAAGTAAAAVPKVGVPAAAEGRFIVHEWGTFLSVQGSDGSTQGGMVDSEDVLPNFVRERSLGGCCRSRFLQKAETPVTYFYSDRRRTVQVRVDMPQGLLTHWFPSVHKFGPPLIDEERVDPFRPSDRPRALPPGGSFLDWGQVEVIPEVPLVQGLPLSLFAMRPLRDDNHWRFARATDAAVVRIGPENRGTPRNGDYEKFLFYRGLGTFDLPLRVTTNGCKSFARLTNSGKELLSGLHLIQVTKDSLAFTALPDLAGSARQTVNHGVFEGRTLPRNEGVARVKQSVAAALVQAGLYPKEAQAMVNTWEKSYFQTEGLRVLYVVPRPLTDAIFPLHVKPLPQELARVMVGRIEVLTPEREAALEQAVGNLSSQHSVERKRAQTTLAQLGRLREPALHRLVAITQRAEVRVRAQQLLRQHESPRL